jgi:hypothetical protein
MAWWQGTHLTWTHYHIFHIKSSCHTLYPHRPTYSSLLYSVRVLLWWRVTDSDWLLRNSSSSYKPLIGQAENATCPLLRYRRTGRKHVTWRYYQNCCVTSTPRAGNISHDSHILFVTSQRCSSIATARPRTKKTLFLYCWPRVCAGVV